tara:strand:- start:1753 stop:3165 length:1413 start_codon:yes stop_codon:yes gene_type:complete
MNSGKDEIKEWYLTVSDRKSNKIVSDIWENNIERKMYPIILSEDPLEKKLNTLFETGVFSHQPENLSCEDPINWHISLLEKNGFDIKNRPQDFTDHDLISCMYTHEVNGRKFSPDFAHRTHYLNEIEKNIKFDDKRLTFAELGSGCGALVRMLKLRFKNSCYLLFDLPETLYFSGSFLKAAFPDSKTLFVEKNTDISNYKDYDFVFVPAGMEQKFNGVEVDLFTNIHSLGEMPNEVISKWFNFMERGLNIKNIFMLNRFLSPHLQKHRTKENQASLLLGKKWDVIRWEYEPDWQRSPYNEMSKHASLLIIAKKGSLKEGDNSYHERSKAIMDQVKRQDWYQLVMSPKYNSPGMLSDSISMILLNIAAILPKSLIKTIKKLTLWNKKSVRHAFLYQVDDRILAHPLISGRLPDFTISGTMFQLWESIRLHPNLENVGTMIKYFEFLSVARFLRYEEYYFYKDLYEELMVKQ